MSSPSFPRGKEMLWLDSTPEIGPYRMLIYPLRDKQALVIPATGPATLMRTPATPPFPAVDVFEASGKLDTDGTLTAHLSVSLRGDNELIYRAAFHQTSRTQWSDMAQNISYRMGFVGTVSNLDVSVPEHTANPFQLSYDYTRKEYADWPNRRITVLMTPSGFPSSEDDDKPADELNLGPQYVETHHSVIELHANYTAVLPKSVKYTTEFATYQMDYKMDGSRFIADRRVEILEGKVPVAKWEQYQKFAKNVQEDEGRFIQLGAPGMVASAEEISNPDAEQLVREAYLDMQSRNFDGARSSLDQAEKLNSRQLGLWAAYGTLNMRNNNVDESLADFKKEVSLHPGNPLVYCTLAGAQIGFKRLDDAEDTLRSLLKIAPNEPSAELLLGSLLMQQKKYEEAATLLTASQKATPDNKNLAIETGRAQIFAGKRTDGEATLRAALDGATDPEILNDAAYELADSGLDLDLAEASCKKSLELLDQEASQFTLGNLPLAESYIYAAWFEGQQREVGDHLGQICEKQGKKQEAANIYALAAASSRISPDPEGRDDMEHRASALKTQGIQVTYPDPSREPGEQRSVSLPKLSKKYASAEFFVEFSPGKVENVVFVHGDEVLKTADEQLRKANFNVPFPKKTRKRN
jgi:Flp pilus assembly protein TadD